MRSWLRPLDMAKGGFQGSYQAGEGVGLLLHVTAIGVGHRRDCRGNRHLEIPICHLGQLGGDKVTTTKLGPC